jgi:hypothetical protein
MTKKVGPLSESGSGSTIQRHGSADLDPDPHQNVMDPQHCVKQSSTLFYLVKDKYCTYCKSHMKTLRGLGSVVRYQYSMATNFYWSFL